MTRFGTVKQKIIYRRTVRKRRTAAVRKSPRVGRYERIKERDVKKELWEKVKSPFDKGKTLIAILIMGSIGQPIVISKTPGGYFQLHCGGNKLYITSYFTDIYEEMKKYITEDELEKSFILT